MTYRAFILKIKDKLPANNGKSQALNLCSASTAALHVKRCAMVLYARQLCVLLLSRINVWSMSHTAWHALCNETNSYSDVYAASPCLANPDFVQVKHMFGS